MLRHCTNFTSLFKVTALMLHHCTMSLKKCCITEQRQCTNGALLTKYYCTYTAIYPTFLFFSPKVQFD